MLDVPPRLINTVTIQRDGNGFLVFADKESCAIQLHSRQKLVRRTLATLVRSIEPTNEYQFAFRSICGHHAGDAVTDAGTVQFVIGRSSVGIVLSPRQSNVAVPSHSGLPPVADRRNVYRIALNFRNWAVTRPQPSVTSSVQMQPVTCVSVYVLFHSAQSAHVPFVTPDTTTFQTSGAIAQPVQSVVPHAVQPHAARRFFSV